jgi:hypothetical protein
MEPPASPYRFRAAFASSARPGALRLLTVAADDRPGFDKTAQFSNISPTIKVVMIRPGVCRPRAADANALSFLGEVMAHGALS